MAENIPFYEEILDKMDDREAGIASQQYIE